MMLLVEFFLTLYVICLPASPATHWVSPTGAATWASCSGLSPLSGASACSIEMANAYAAAGDLVYLRAGTYLDGVISPTNSGTPGSPITFKAYTGETPIIKHNLVSNWHMELDSNWTSVGSPITNERSSTQAYSGKYSRNFTVDAEHEGIQSDAFTTKAGSAYIYRAWVWTDQTSVNVYVVNGGGAVIKDVDHSGLTANTWNWVVGTVFTGTAGSGAYIAFRSPTGVSSGTWYIDEAMVVRYQAAFDLQNKDYIKVSGINFTQVERFFNMVYGSNYNEIDSCIFDRDAAIHFGAGIISHVNTAGLAGHPSAYNWIHNSTFSHVGAMINCINIGSAIMVGYGDTVDTSYYNLIENNILYECGHDCLTVRTKYNTVRNNTVHNEESYFQDHWRTCSNIPKSGYFGDRNVMQEDTGGTNVGYNLFEGNRLGYGGLSPNVVGANGFENANPHTIVRYNAIYGNREAGYEAKTQGANNSDYNRIYNNTFFSNGKGADINLGYRAAIFVDCETANHPANNVLINNIFYGNQQTMVYTGTNCLAQFTNINYLTADPLFLNPDITDPNSLVMPNLSLQAQSRAIDGGRYLARAIGAGTSSTTLIVDDASYFQDGTWAPSGTSNADWVAIGTVNNVVQIDSIDYATNKITLVSPMTWSYMANIWLYKKSDATRVLYGAAPDYGAYEYKGQASIASPTNLRIVGK
jgi:hypothetical protein